MLQNLYLQKGDKGDLSHANAMIHLWYSQYKPSNKNLSHNYQVQVVFPTTTNCFSSQSEM